jgi:hypothetical protein
MGLRPDRRGDSHLPPAAGVDAYRAEFVLDTYGLVRAERQRSLKVFGCRALSETSGEPGQGRKDTNDEQTGELPHYSL